MNDECHRFRHPACKVAGPWPLLQGVASLALITRDKKKQKLQYKNQGERWVIVYFIWSTQTYAYTATKWGRPPRSTPFSSPAPTNRAVLLPMLLLLLSSLAAAAAAAAAAVPLPSPAAAQPARSSGGALRADWFDGSSTWPNTTALSLSLSSPLAPENVFIDGYNTATIKRKNNDALPPGTIPIPSHPTPARNQTVPCPPPKKKKQVRHLSQ